MDQNEALQMQARAYLKGVQDILASFDEAATLMMQSGISPELHDFLEHFAKQMRNMRAQILDQFEAMGVNVDGLGW